MTHRKSVLIALLGVSILATGCTIKTRSNLSDAQYWQRSNATSSIYLSGPKAQQMLQRDIAQCVTDIRELERLGAIRNAIPIDTQMNGEVTRPQAPEGALELYNTPHKDRYLYSEYYSYQDFETCMQDKGWERTQFLPYEQAERSRRDYYNTIIGTSYRTKVGEKRPEPSRSTGDFDQLNH